MSDHGPAGRPCAAGGTRLRAAEVAGFSIAEVVHRPGSTLPRHAHAGACLTFLLDGGYTESFAARRVECAPPGRLVKPAGEPHRDAFSRDAGARCLVVQASAQRELGLRDAGVRFERVEHRRDAHLAALGLRLATELRRWDAVSPLAVEGLLLELAVAWGRRADARVPPAWLRRVHDYLEAHCTSVPSLAEVARQASVHPATLSRAFRRAFHCTPAEHLRAARFRWAVRQLGGTDAPLSEIALAAGYADQSHFTRDCRRRVGLTPAAFRRAGAEIGGELHEGRGARAAGGRWLPEVCAGRRPAS